MSLSTRILAVIVPTLALLLTAIAGYSYSQIRHLSLPIPQALALFTVFLPVIASISVPVIDNILRAGLHQRRVALSLFAIHNAQLIYEMILVVLSLAHMIPGKGLDCGLQSRWATLYRAHDADAVRRIQDSFQCCGLNSNRDMPWPFPSGRPGEGVDVGECQRLSGNSQACIGPWRQAEQINAGLLFLVAFSVFFARAISMSYILFTWKKALAWAKGGRQITNGEGDGTEQDDGRAMMRGLINDSSVDDQHDEEYHDDEATPHERYGKPARGEGQTPEVERGPLLDGLGPWRNRP